MSRQTITVVVATLLGVAVGGLVFWKVVRRRKDKSSVVPNQGGVAKEREQEDHSKEKLLSFISPPTVPWVEKILGAEVVIIAEAKQWNEVEPLLKEELECCPVLGIDCEWVSLKSCTEWVFWIACCPYTSLETLEKICI